MVQLMNRPESAHIRESVMGESGMKSDIASTVSNASGTSATSPVDIIPSIQRTRNENLNLCFIQTKLQLERYDDPLHFASDIRTLFNESKQCNASKKSKVGLCSAFYYHV